MSTDSGLGPSLQKLKRGSPLPSADDSVIRAGASEAQTAEDAGAEAGTVRYGEGSNRRNIPGGVGSLILTDSASNGG